MARISKSVVSVTVNGVTHTVNVGQGSGGSVSVTTANGKTTVTVNGVTVSVGTGTVGGITQTVTAGANSVVINNSGVTVLRTGQGGSVGRSAPKKKEETPIEEIKNCFVELDVALGKGAEISDSLIRELAPCKQAMEKARAAQNSFKAYKEKMSGEQFPIYSMRNKPKANAELYDDSQNKVNDGYAIISVGSGTTYEGVIFEGKMCGPGSIFTPKYSYAGYFDKNKEAGKGIYALPDGNEIAVYDGYGIITKNNELVAFGQVKKYTLDGYGVDLSDLSDIKCGKFKNGVFVE